MKNIAFLIVIIVFALLTSINAQEKAASDYTKIPKSDCHVHLVDFLQNGEFWSEKDREFVPPSPRSTLPHGNRGARIVSLLKRMEHANVKHAMVSGMPFVKKWSRNDTFRSKYYLDSGSRMAHARDTDYTVALAFSDFLASNYPNAREERKKLYPFISGFDATDMGAVDMIVKRIKEFPGLWEGIGEVMSRHDDLTNLTTGERPVGNHPAIHRIAHFAGAFDLPVIIHHNMAPVSPNGRPKDPLYLSEIEELFDAHPKTVFIWCHAGISRRVVVEELPAIIRQVLGKPGRKDHVFIDLSWVVYENYIYHNATGHNPISIDNREIWAKLIAEYDKNFMIGSDAVARFDRYSEEINKYAPLFQAIGNLPDGDRIVKHVAHENFWQIMESLRERRSGSGLHLPVDYQYPEKNFTETKGRYVIESAQD